jgi:hypothetical protein
MDNRCDICGELFDDNSQKAEMFDPEEPTDESVICHAECGLQKGFEVA